MQSENCRQDTDPDRLDMDHLKTSDVIVVGAGLSGLSAAKLLHESGQDVLVLEANDRVGGRTLNFYDEAINYTDLGGAYIGPTQDRIYRLAKEMGVDTVRCYDTGMAISYHRGRWRKMSGLHPDTWNPLENLELNHFWHLIDRMGEKIPFDRPWDFPEAAEWDSMTVKEWAEKTFWFQLTRDVLYVHCSAEFCAEAKDLSLLYFLWYIKEGGGYMRMSATDNGAQERKFIGGSQRICLNIAEHLGKGNVLLSKPVSSIEQDADGVKVTTITGDSYKAKYIITALPPAMLCKIKFTPSLPALRNQLNQRYPMGSVIKTMMYYKRPFWRDQNFSCNIYADGIISATQDDCSEGSNAIIGFMTGDSAREHCHLTKEERKDLIAKQYAVLLRTDEALEPIFYVEKNWMEEPYIGGGYVGYTAPGVITKYCKVIREPIGRLFFAGTETATKWSGYMDGAVQAGERAAREVLHAMGKVRKDEIWQEEPECKEMPALPFQETFLERSLPSVSGFLIFLGTSLTLLAVGEALWMCRGAIQLQRVN